MDTEETKNNVMDECKGRIKYIEYTKMKFKLQLFASIFHILAFSCAFSFEITV